MKRSRVLALAVAVGMAGCGESEGPTTPPVAQNRPPTASFSVHDSPAIAGVSEVTFLASGADPDGDAVSFAWNLGDGSTGSGSRITHVYRAPGTYAVTLTASDARGASVTQTGEARARLLSGFWREQTPFVEGFYGIDVVQEGSNIRGRVVSPFATATGPLRGSVSADRTFRYSTTYAGSSYSESFEGRLDASLTQIPGVITANNGAVYNVVLLLQP